MSKWVRHLPKQTKRKKQHTFNFWNTTAYCIIYSWLFYGLTQWVVERKIIDYNFSYSWCYVVTTRCPQWHTEPTTLLTKLKRRESEKLVPLYATVPLYPTVYCFMKRAIGTWEYGRVAVAIPAPWFKFVFTNTSNRGPTEGSACQQYAADNFIQWTDCYLDSKRMRYLNK